MREHGKTSSAFLLLTLIFFISLLALTCAAPYNHNQLLKVPKVPIEEAIAFSAFSVLNWRSHSEALTLLNLTTRMDICNFIKNNPGMHFRALSNHLSMPVGVLQYHLGLLVNGGLLSTYQDGRYKRYFESKRFTDTEMKVISVLRHPTTCKILTMLREKPETTHKNLAMELNISSQALSWQMRRLEEMGFVKKETEAMNVQYCLEKSISAMVNQCLTIMAL